MEGRTFPVEVIYAPLDELGRDYAENDENEDKESCDSHWSCPDCFKDSSPLPKKVREMATLIAHRRLRRKCNQPMLEHLATVLQSHCFGQPSKSAKHTCSFRASFQLTVILVSN